MTDWKALCKELLTDYKQHLYRSVLADKVDAALAEQVAERPPAVTIGALLHPAYEPGDGSADGAQMVGMAWWHPVMGCDSLQIVVDNARAVLARWGSCQAFLDNSAPAPAGEVQP